MLYLVISIISFLFLTVLIIYIKVLIQRVNLKDQFQEYYNNNVDSIGSWHGGTFYAQPLFMLDEVKSNPDLNTEIISYNKKVKLFYFFFTLFLFLSFLIKLI